MKIKMPRGDIHYVTFQIKDAQGQASSLVFDEIYFSVKKDFNNKTLLFQKKLSNGSITYDSETHKYSFRINPEDTNNLKYGDYVCDIELNINDELKQTTVGTLTITDEVTFAEDEDTNE